MKRRHFLQSTAAGAATLAAPNLFLRAADAAKNPVIGEGQYKYECHHGWGELPEGHDYGNASHGVAFDSAGLVYISHQGKPASVFVFDPDGKFVRSLAPQHLGNGHGIDIRKEEGGEFIYLSPNGGGPCAKLTLKGEVVWQGGKPPESHRYDNKQPFNATNISFCPDGGWHVGDGYGSSYLHRFDKAGNYVCTFGGKGTDNTHFNTPHGHWLDDRDGIPKVAVCDRANNRLVYMTLDGQHLSILPNIDGPASLDIRGDIMLCTEVFIGRLVLLDKNNNVLIRLGKDDEWQKTIKDTPNMRAKRDLWPAGKFVHPHDGTFDRDGNIFITEWVVGGRVTKLRHVS